MSYNDSLQNILLASGIKVDEALAAEIAKLDAEAGGGERRPIIPPEKLREHLSQWHKVPRTDPKKENLPASAPPKTSRPDTGMQRENKHRRLYDPHDQCKASGATGGVNSANNTTTPMPKLIVTTPDPKHRKASGTFHPELMDDFLSEILKWSETSQTQPAEQDANR